MKAKHSRVSIRLTARFVLCLFLPYLYVETVKRAMTKSLFAECLIWLLNRTSSMISVKAANSKIMNVMCLFVLQGGW